MVLSVLGAVALMLILAWIWLPEFVYSIKNPGPLMASICHIEPKGETQDRAKVLRQLELVRALIRDEEKDEEESEDAPATALKELYERVKEDQETLIPDFRFTHFGATL
jgi:hypothetical protein